MNATRIENYAQLMVRMGANVQKGQTVVLSAPVVAADFARLCVKKCYEAGAREVMVRWTDEPVQRERYLHADDAVFDEFPQWEEDFFNHVTDRGAVFLSIISRDPEAFKGVDSTRMHRARIAEGPHLKYSRDKRMGNFNAWSLGAVPNPRWAKKVFPDCTEDAAMERLWDAILNAVYVDADAVDPCAKWDAHVKTMARRIDILNSYGLTSLHYQNSLGTDLVVGMPERHIWVGGSERTREQGIPFAANIPTEEIFSLPNRNAVEGTVVASMPLVMNGNVITGIRFTLKAGKIVSAHADENESFLIDALNTDEGARYLGEVALVPYDSPIRQSGVFFYNTLFDENAACHFAFGSAYSCFSDIDTCTPEELARRGMNDSFTHVDFMIGTKDLSITGTTSDGRTVPIFVDGNFAF